MPAVRHTRIQANKLLISQSGICGRQRPQKWTEGVSYSRHHLPSLPNPSPICPSSLSPLDACYTGYVMPSGEGNEKGEKNRSNQQKRNFARAAHFFCTHFFAVVLHDCNVKLPETSSYTFYGGNVGRVLVQLFFFSLSLIFTLMAASIPPLQNFMFFLQQKMCPFVFSLSL